MTDTPSPDAANPVPDAGQGGSEVQLGPDLSIYPENLRPAETTVPTPQTETPAPADGEQVIDREVDAGPEPSPQQGEEPQQTRRQRGQDLYERGLAEGRAAVEAERAQAQARQQADQTAREATQRVEQLFAGLESSDPNQQNWARRGILELYRGNQQAAALQSTTRQQILVQMAQDFQQLRGADGIDDAAYEQLHSAPSPVELAQRAMALGKKSRDDEVARLEAELTQLRGRLVGRTATPQPANGIAGGAAGISWDDYISMSPAEARKLSSRQIDAITAEHFREVQAATNGR